jgi:NHLM bacteriocin system ABC transporter ATP-binding protein
MSILEEPRGDASASVTERPPTPATPAYWLATALGIVDEQRLVSGRDRLDLHTEGDVWLILSGAVDVFLADGLGHYPMGRCAAGSLVDAFPAPPDGMAAIGIPTADTVIVATTRAALQRLAANAELGPLVAQAWQGWRSTFAAWDRTGATQPPLEDASRFVAGILQSVLQRRAADIAQHGARLAAAERSAANAFAHGLDSVVDLIGVGARVGLQPVSETFATAAERVIMALGLPEITLRPDAYGDLVAAIGDIARDNGLQFRAIELQGDWWRSDIGPFAGTFGPEKRPCALIYSGGRYMIHADGAPRIVDAALARQIGRVAYTFYLPFPAGRMSGPSLLRFALHGARADVVTILCTLLVTGLVSLLIPLALGWLMDPIIPDASRNQVAVVAGFLALLAIGATSSSIVQAIASLRLEAIADNRVQAAVWIRLLNLRADFFRGFTAGDLANRADGINAMRKLMSQSFATFASASVSLLFSLGLMVWYSWQIALAVAFALAIFGACAYFVGRRILACNFTSLELTGKLQGVVLQLMGSVAKLRTAGAERQAFLRWLELYRRSVVVNLQQRISGNRLTVARSMFDPFITVIVLVVMGLHSGDLFAFFELGGHAHGNAALMSTASFVAFNAALGQFTAAMMSITRGMLSLAMLQPYMRRVQPILDEPEEPAGQGRRLGTMQGEIELRDVRFRYEAEAPLVLRGLSLKVPTGAFVAIVGPSGAGKSSILRLLLGFDAPESGAIYVDGTDMKMLDARDLRQHYGVVLQNGRILAGSIYDNITSGLPRPPEEVMEALRIAAFDDYVKSLPMGLHTNIADAGATFSGGQRQRLMIARAVIRRPQVLIMDEATSALDNVTQRQVVENLRALNCTQIVVAQRLSTIVGADLIYVVDEGRVVESGTYDQLLQTGPIFRKMIERQTL